MSSLGFLSIYSLAASRDEFMVERFFCAGAGPPASHESGRPLAGFPLICSSLSFECDYWLLWDALREMGLGPDLGRPGDRLRDAPPKRDPGNIVVLGGIGPWSNPYPVMPMADVILTGEGELSFSDFLSAMADLAFRGIPKEGVLEGVAGRVRGALVPSLLPKALRQGRGPDLAAALKAFAPVAPPRLPHPFPEGLAPPSSPIHSEGAGFPGTKLVEIGRGCPHGCRFCLAGSLYRPHRPWDMGRILKAIRDPNPWDGAPAFPGGAPVGLVSPAVADHPDFGALLAALVAEGRKVSFSSLRVSALTADICALLAKGKVKGIAVAPEAGTQGLRDAINKNLTEGDILGKARLLKEAGLSSLKLYFMVGLPGERDQDLKGIGDLAAGVRDALAKGAKAPRITLSVSHFVPKPHTAFEDEPMPSEVGMRRRGEFLRKIVAPLGGIDLRLESPAATVVQALLSRGGPGSFALVDGMRVMGGKPKAALNFVGYREAAAGAFNQLAERPWRIVRGSPGIPYLDREKGRAGLGVPSEPCPDGMGCGACEACGGTGG
jgi:radical SAM superfamily enzyme YgiQ (UPF0313 family)